MYDVLRGLMPDGTFLLNTIWEGEELAKNLPNKVKRYLAQNNITVYYINASKIAQEIGLGNRTNTILQSAFFRITEVIPVDLAVEQMKKFIQKSYGKKGENIVNMNYAAVDRGGEYHTIYCGSVPCQPYTNFATTRVRRGATPVRGLLPNSDSV